MHQQIDQHRRLPHQTHIVLEVGLLQPSVQGLTVAALTGILRLMGVSSCSGMTEMSMEKYTRLLMDASPEFPIHFL
jgi:hypothetical protein